MTFCQVFGAVLIFVLSVTGVGLLVATGVSYDWFISNQDTASQVRDGLWRQCVKIPNKNEKCSTHSNAFKFVERKEQDVMILFHIMAVVSTVIGIFITLRGLCKHIRSKCIEICASSCFVTAAICVIFLVVYTEVEFFKGTDKKRGWAVYTLYAAMAVTMVTSADALLYALCCHEKYLEGFDKSDSLVLKKRPRSERRYLPSESHHGIENNSYHSHQTYEYAKDY